MGISDAERTAVSALQEGGAVNFDVIGDVLKEHGPALAREAVNPSSSRLEPWEDFCWTMRFYFRIYRRPPVVLELEGLDRLKHQVSGELHE